MDMDKWFTPFSFRYLVTCKKTSVFGVVKSVDNSKCNSFTDAKVLANAALIKIKNEYIKDFVIDAITKYGDKSLLEGGMMQGIHIPIKDSDFYYEIEIKVILQ